MHMRPAFASGRRRVFAWALSLLLLACVMSGRSAVAAPFEDSMAQRVLACTGCHGRDGRAVGDAYFPRIAGKPAGYLFNQLRNFRDGKRSYSLMTGMVALLSDDYLREIARYFSALDLPYPAPRPSQSSADTTEVAMALVTQGDPGRKLSACAACHGAVLTGVLPNVPGLLGLPRDYINAQLGAWKSGQRQAAAPDCMVQVARALTVDEVSAVSAWLSAQPLPANTHAIPIGDLARATTVRPACGSAPELKIGTP